MAWTQLPKRLVSYELINFAARDAAAFIDFGEQSYAGRLRDAARTILASGRRLVMMTGPSSVGKTTTANRLAAEIKRRGRPCQVVSLDDFFVGEGRYPKRSDGSDDYECPDALDLPVLRAFLQGLVCEGHGCMPTFDFLTQRPTGQMREVECRQGVVIVEGLHALNPILTETLAADSFLNLYASLREEYTDGSGKLGLETREIRLARRMTRDSKFRGHPADFTLDLWEHVCASERQYVQAFRERADLVLDTSFSYEPCLWGPILTRMMEGQKGAYRRQMKTLCAEFAPFALIDTALVPADSMLREFLGAEHQ